MNKSKHPLGVSASKTGTEETTMNKITLGWKDKRGAGHTRPIDPVELQTEIETMFRRKIVCEAWNTDDRSHVVGQVWKQGREWNWFVERI